VLVSIISWTILLIEHVCIEATWIALSMCMTCCYVNVSWIQSNLSTKASQGEIYKWP